MTAKTIEEIVDIYFDRYPHLTTLAENCKKLNNYHSFKVAAPEKINVADLLKLTSY